MTLKEGTHIGENFSQGQNCVIGSNVRIGSSVAIGHNCIIEDGAQISDGVVIGHNCIVGSECTIGSGTRLMNNIELRTNTVVGKDCYVDSGVKSSGNARIGDHVCPQVMTNNLDHKRVAIGGAHVGKRAFIGTNATLAAGIKIADGVVIGSKAFATKDCPEENGIYIGMPAKLRG